MALFGSPAPQWTDEGASIAAVASRLVPFLDPSGFWTLIEAGGIPTAAFIEHASGFTIIDDTVTVGLKPTLLPSGMVVIY